MERVFWIKFYEDGVFCSAIGQPKDTYGDAVYALASLAAQIAKQGFAIDYSQVGGFTYDRYGTLCTLKIEEDNQ